jgi:hypothetical protein
MAQLRLALAGDTMLGRKVANAIGRVAARPLVDARVADSVREADLFVLNLECCIAERGEIESRSEQHEMHSSLLVLGTDCGCACMLVFLRHRAGL